MLSEKLQREPGDASLMIDEHQQTQISDTFLHPPQNREEKLLLGEGGVERAEYNKLLKMYKMFVCEQQS